MKRIAAVLVLATLFGLAQGNTVSREVACSWKSDEVTSPNWVVAQKKCDLAKCLDNCEKNYDPDKCIKDGGAVVNCRAAYRNCQHNCTAKCE